LGNNVIQFPKGTVPQGANGQQQGAGGGGGNRRPHPYLWPRQQVWSFRHNRKYNTDQKIRIIHNFITTYENRKHSRGAAFLRTPDAQAFLFDAQRCKLYRIDEKDPEFCGYLWNVYNLNSSESITKHIISSLKNGTIADGSPREVRRFSYYDRYNHTLYVSRYDGTCYVVDGTEVLIRPNGWGPAVFLDDDDGEGVDEPIVGNNGHLFEHLIDDLQYVPSTQGGMSPEAQRCCLAIWLFATAFPDLLPHKPALLVEGQKGSGKTTALQRIVLALHGKAKVLSVQQNDEQDFGVKILRSPIAVIDNVDTPIPWLKDTICQYVTGGGWTRRKLFTDDRQIELRPQSFLAFATKNPGTLRRDDVADRFLIVRLERREENAGYIPAEVLFERIQSWREEILGEWLFWCKEIVKALKTEPAVQASKYRMADFARFAHIVGRVLRNPSDGPIPAGDWSEEAIDEMLESMKAEQDVLAVEGDSLIDVLDKWMDIQSNQGRDVKAADLFRELSEIAKALRIPFYRSPKALAARLRDAGGAFAHHFQIERQPGAGGVMMYTFRRT